LLRFRVRFRRQVVPELGLCVTLYEILEVEGGAVYAGEGAALFTVKFSMVRASNATPRTALAGPRVRTLARMQRRTCFTAERTAHSRAPAQVFFRPFTGEVVTGRIKSADHQGLRVRALARRTSSAMQPSRNVHACARC
jgi:DNA-directed RNA polymerase subunit E'/Rpb7